MAALNEKRERELERQREMESVFLCNNLGKCCILVLLAGVRVGSLDPTTLMDI